MMGFIDKKEKNDSDNVKILRHEIVVFVLNDQKQVLLQKRSANKKFFPNQWALCTGHVEEGESFEEAAIREIKEEIGLDINIDELYSFWDGKFTRCEANSHITCYFYIKCNLPADTFVIQTEELSEVQWFYISDVIQMIHKQEGQIVHKKNRLYLFEALSEMVESRV